MRRPLATPLCILLACAASVPGTAGAPAAGERALRRAMTAAGRIRYHGIRTTTLWLDSGAQAFETVEDANGRGQLRVEYRAPASARGRVVLNDGRRQWRIAPPGSRALPPPADSGEGQTAWNLRLLLRNYQVLADGETDRIARRPARRITLKPRHQGKPQETLWVDTETSLILKRDARHADGAPARSTALSEVTYGPPTRGPSFHLRPADAGTALPPPPLPARDASSARAFLGSPPFRTRLSSLGFELYNVARSEKDRKRSVHLLYHDGLSTLSLFVDREGARRRMAGARPVQVSGHPALIKMGGHFGMLRWSAGSLRYTLVGDLTAGGLTEAARELMELP
jgi:hypothetical protein